MEKTFRKRMQQYAEEGIKHFYFMMLQKEEVSLSRFPACLPEADSDSTSTRRRRVALGGSRITHVTPTPRCRSG